MIIQVRVAAGWSRGCDTRVYAQVPTADALAIRAGFRDQDRYLVTHLVLDPTQMSEFSAMALSVFQEVPALLAEMRQVMLAAVAWYEACLCEGESMSL